MRRGLEFWCIGTTVEALHTKSWRGTAISVTTCNNFSIITIKLRVLFLPKFFSDDFLPPFCTCMPYTNCCMLQQNSNVHVLRTQVTWTSSPGRFLLGWGSFLEGESLLRIDEREKEGEQGWNQRIQRMQASLRKKREYSYEDCLFLLLILSTSTVIVIPISTPAASNKAITLMTSPVAICGKGFSAEKKQTPLTNLIKPSSSTLNWRSSFSLRKVFRTEKSERLCWERWWNYLSICREKMLRAILLMTKKQKKILPMTLISTDADRVPMLLVASHAYVPCTSYVSGPLKMRTLSLISALLGIEPLILIQKKKNNFWFKST